MPELPEVETTLRGLEPHLTQQIIAKIIIRHPTLRWPIPAHLKDSLPGQRVLALTRRGKYILFQLDKGTLLLHLGMSGRVHLLENAPAAKLHDHVDIIFNNQLTLRFTDPRRFGALLYTELPAEEHPLLSRIGPEPLTSAFDGNYLWQRAQKRKTPVKSFIMDSQVVAGVGNIYATEALFMAQIDPRKPAGKVPLATYKLLANAIKTTLKAAIKQGGTTLKDFMKSDGTPGYFSIKLKAYGRAGQPCLRCGGKLVSVNIGQRSTVFCRKCQG